MCQVRESQRYDVDCVRTEEGNVRIRGEDESGSDEGSEL
jgi:hypothetical protein